VQGVRRTFRDEAHAKFEVGAPAYLQPAYVVAEGLDSGVRAADTDGPCHNVSRRSTQHGLRTFWHSATVSKIPRDGEARSVSICMMLFIPAVRVLVS
jgi:hypothetical protein